MELRGGMKFADRNVLIFYNETKLIARLVLNSEVETNAMKKSVSLVCNLFVYAVSEQILVSWRAVEGFLNTRLG